tara:strand:- start:217 stop:726 length:510 start_codon:yes stop_codon:yes gene_type:complete
MIKLKDLLTEWNDTSFRNLPKRWSKPVMKGHEPDGLTEFERLGGKDPIWEELTDADIKVGDAYHVKTQRGKMIDFVYEKERRGGATTIEYQFKPQYGEPGFMSVGSGNADSVDGWGKNKKIKVTSKMKKTMIKTLEDAIKSKYKGSEETEVLLRNNLRLSDVLRWVKRL